MSKVKNENFITIQGWMVNELELKGNELLIYALIYGFSQDGEQSFNGSLQYIADWTNSTKAGVTKALKRLVEKGYIKKHDVIINSVKFCEYHTTKLDTHETKLHGGMQQSCIGYETKLHGGMQQSCTNNILDNTDNKILDNIEDSIDSGSDEPTPTPKKAKPVKHKYGEYEHVLLTDKERDKLFEEKGEVETLEAIKYLDEYIEMYGKKYKNHNLVLRKWVFDAVREKKEKKPKQQGQAYGMPAIDWDSI